MQTHLRTRHLVFPFLLLLFLATGTGGCSFTDWSRRPVRTGPSPESPPSDAVSVPELDPARVEARITALEDFLAQKAPDQGEKAEAARELLDGYRGILDALEGSSGKETPDDHLICAMLFERLEALEKLFFQKDLAKGPSADALRRLSHERDRIRNTYLSGDHDDVVEACQQLEKRYGGEAFSPDIAFLHAVSLAETGKVREAIRVGERILPALQGRPGWVDLGSRLVTWYLESGDQEQAREHYEKLVDAVNEDRRLLDLAEMTLMPTQADPKSRGAVEETPSEAPDEFSSEYVDELLRRVDALVQQKAFDQAKLLLIRHRIRTPEGPQANTLDQAMARLEREEQSCATAPREGEHEPILFPEQSLDEVRQLVESDQHEAALQQLDRMQASEVQHPELQSLRDRAAAGIISKKRDEAAKAFLKARNTSDSNLKKEHLRNAYHILKALVDRFPTSPLLPKVQSNLETVRTEMRQAGIPQEPKRP